MAKPSSDSSTAQKQFAEKYNFTAWLAAWIGSARAIVITLITAIPSLLTIAFTSRVTGFLTNFINGSKGGLDYDTTLKGSIYFQLFIILVLICYLTYRYVTRGNDFPQRIQHFVNQLPPSPPTSQPELKYRLFLRLPPKADTKLEFKNALSNMHLFRLFWMGLWITWFFYYLSFALDPPGSRLSSLFNFFFFTETVAFALCYFILSIPLVKPFVHAHNYWWVILLIIPVLSINILDVADLSLEGRFLTRIAKVIVTATVLGMMVGRLATPALGAPSWLQIGLYTYVALQPLFFAMFDFKDLLRSETYQPAYVNSRLIPNERVITPGQYFDSLLVEKESTLLEKEMRSKRELQQEANQSEYNIATVKFILNRFARIFSISRIILLNMSLLLKYLLFLYVLWLLEKGHLFLYFLSAQGFSEYDEEERERFEAMLHQDSHHSTTP